jgi:RNase P protein component
MAVREALGPATPPIDIVLVGRAETATCPYSSLVKDLRWCLKRLEVTGHEKNTDAAS